MRLCISLHSSTIFYERNLCYVSKKTIILFFSLISLTVESNCIPISSLPIVINKPGTYCLTNNLVNKANQHAITIAVSGVAVDMQGFTVDSANLQTDNSLYGIYSLDARDITIKNGIIRGFMYGIYLSDSKGSDTSMDSLSGGYLIENMVITNSLSRGIRIEGANNVIKNCTVTSTGGTTLFDNSFAIGIEIFGPGSVIENNTVTETYACGKGESVAISFSNNASGSNAYSNRITNKKRKLSACHSLGLSQGQSFGIWVGGNLTYKTNVYIRNNNISNVDYGFVFSTPPTGWYGNNQISQVRCKYMIGSNTVSTFNFKGKVPCERDLLSLDELNLINSILIGSRSELKMA